MNLERASKRVVEQVRNVSMLQSLKRWRRGSMPETKKEIVVRFKEESSAAVREMAEEEGVPVFELITRAVNFYQVRMDAVKNNKQVLLQRQDGVLERVLLPVDIQFQQKIKDVKEEDCDNGVKQ